MNGVLTAAAPLPLPAPDSHWREWVTYGLRWAAARPPIADSARDAVVDGGRFMTLHAYREAEPGPRWRALYDATWPAYRSWYTREGLAARPSLRVCRHYGCVAMRSPDISPNWSRPGSGCAVSAVTTRSPPGCCRCGVFPRSRSAAPK